MTCGEQVGYICWTQSRVTAAVAKEDWVQAAQSTYNQGCPT